MRGDSVERVEPLWWLTRDGDLDCQALYERHYSCHHYRDGRRARDKRFVGPGEKIVLRTERGDAMFVWRQFVDDCIDQRTGERQAGICCAVFRNESPHRRRWRNERTVVVASTAGIA